MLTATDFYRYFQCPHWPYWERYGDPKDRRLLTKAEEERQAEGLEHEERIAHSLLGPFEQVDIETEEEGIKSTLELMKQGVSLIYQGWIIDEQRGWVGRPDLLEKREGKSRFGEWYYVPIDIKRAHQLRKDHMAQLTFYAAVLETVQGVFPAYPAIINADGERLPFEAAEFLSEFQSIARELERIDQGECPDPVYRKSCEDTSPWGAACRRLAEERKDIALLYNVDTRKLRALRAHGIYTVQDAAELDPLALEGAAPGFTLRALQAVQRQARSLYDSVVMIRQPFFHETQGLEIHFDIESYPPTDRDYLFGFWIGGYETGEYKAFVAESAEQEQEMWKTFLQWIETLPADYTVYHYAAYEPARLSILARRYGDEEHVWLKRFCDRLVDVKQLTSDHAVFPLYFYSLKMIGKFLGFAWKGEVKGGGESVYAYEAWLKTRDRHVLDAIVQYNREDVQATAFLLAWLKKYAKHEKVYSKPYPWQ